MNFKVHHIFAVLGLVFGLIILWLTPPFQSPDETNHYHRSAHLASGHLMGKIKDGNRLGGEIDRGLLTYSMYFDSIRKSPDPTFDQVDYTLTSELSRSGDTFVDFANVGYYSPTVYLPQLLGQVVSSLFRMSPHQSLYITRLFSLFCWIFIITLAIKIIPIQKILICFLALLPSSLSLAACISGDTFTSSLCFLWIALLLRAILMDHKVDIKEFILLCFIIGLITINKLVYFPLALMILLVPNDKIEKGKILKSILLFITFVILIIWIPYSKSLFIPYSDYSPLFRDAQQLNPPVNPSAQLNWILSHPLQFTKVALTTYVDTAPATIAHYIGKFGWEKNYLHPLIIGMLGLGIVLLSISRTENTVSLKSQQRLVLISIGLLMVIGLSISLYLQWSPVGHYRIESLSGRYFIPIMPVLFLTLTRIKVVHDRRLKLFVFVLTLIGLLCLIANIFYRW